MTIIEEKTSSPSSSAYSTPERPSSKSSIIEKREKGDDANNSADSSKSNKSNSQQVYNEEDSTWGEFETLIPLTETLSSIWNQFNEASEIEDVDDSSGTASTTSDPPAKNSSLRIYGMAGAYTPQPEDQPTDENSKTREKLDQSIEMLPGKSNKIVLMASSRETSPTNSADSMDKNEQATGKNSRASKRILFKVTFVVLFVFAVVLIGVGVVIYTKSSDSTPPETSSPSVSPSSTFSPSSSPTLPLIFEPPLPEDCDRIRSGDTVQGQESLIERNFNVVMDVAMGGIVGLTETMKLLELEMQQKLIPKLVGCEAQNRRLQDHRELRNANRYIVGNGRIEFRPASLDANAGCSSRLCLTASFSMDLLLKTQEEEFFIVVDLVEELFAGDLIDELQLERPLFVSVKLQSVAYNDPTKAPSSMPSFLPSGAPSQKPTRVPSQIPTGAPTRRPTFRPTPGPTPPPTGAPTRRPTFQPTPGPTPPPTGAPTRRPTFQPTPRPTPPPTRAPSSEPSASPTFAPTTSSPTRTPSINPTDSPSQKPSSRPSNMPTRSPSKTPTREPSISPTPLPTAAPSAAPTLSPTTSPPTREPSTQPTQSPTPRPSQMPTSSPSMTPSSSPTGYEDRNGYFTPLDRRIVVSCAGDSLTQGTSGGNTKADSYPSQLTNQIGSDFKVYNFGRNAATAMRGQPVSYVDQVQFQNSLNVQPDIYLLMLGTNDSKYWAADAPRFAKGLQYIINKVKSISPASPRRIIMAIPPWVKTDDEFGIQNSIVANNVRREIINVANQQNLQLVDMHAVTVNKGNFYSSDGLHLNRLGYDALATAWRLAIVCNSNGICEAGENCETCPGDCYLNCPSRVQ